MTCFLSHRVGRAETGRLTWKPYTTWDVLLPSLTPGVFQPGGPISGETNSPWSLNRNLPTAQTSIPGSGQGCQRRAPAPGPCTRQPGSRASVAPLLPAPVGIGNRKKQTGPGTQQLRPRRPAPQVPQGFPHLLPGGGGSWQAGPSLGLTKGLWATDLEIRRPLPFAVPLSPFRMTHVHPRHSNSDRNRYGGGSYRRAHLGKADHTKQSWFPKS